MLCEDISRHEIESWRNLCGEVLTAISDFVCVLGNQSKVLQKYRPCCPVILIRGFLLAAVMIHELIAVSTCNDFT